LYVSRKPTWTLHVTAATVPHEKTDTLESWH
jgi:hypothetical protein